MKAPKIFVVVESLYSGGQRPIAWSFDEREADNLAKTLNKGKDSGPHEVEEVYPIGELATVP